MKKQISTQAIYAASLLAISLVTVPAQAALTKVAAQPKEQAIVEDAITPEATSVAEDEEVIVVKKKKPTTVVKKTTVVQEKSEIEAPVADAAPSAVAVAVAAPAAAKPTTGQQLDDGIKNKMLDVQNQFEAALLKSLDRIKVTVDDSPGVATPNQQAVIQDNLVGASAAEDKSAYMSMKDAPAVNADDEEDLEGGESVAKLPKEEKKDGRKIRVAPVFGKTEMSSSAYNISSRYTAGFELEMDVDTNFALVFGYSYSQFDIALANNNAFYGYYNGQNLNSLAYNQNLFEIDGRVYLMPAEKKFRIFGGAGVGYNLGYLNYNQNQYVQNQYYNPYYNTGMTDYTVKSWLGLLSAGANFNVSENVSLGAIFKYALVFSSSQNQPLNNYGFVNNGAYGTTNDQAIVGGSLQKENFYSMLGTIKVAF